MSKIRAVVTENAADVADALGLAPADAINIELRSQINDKIIQGVKKSGLTHAQLAKAAGTSRSRLTAILNRNRRHVSTDLMLRILSVLGYRTRISFQRVKRAA